MEAVLTAQERHQLVTVLQDLDRSAPQERRRHLRRKTLINLWMQRITQTTGPRFAKIVLVDVSATGVGLLACSTCQIGEQLVLRLPFIEGGGWLVLCEVRNCQRLANGQFKIGCRFLARIEDANGDAKIPSHWRST